MLKPKKIFLFCLLLAQIKADEWRRMIPEMSLTEGVRED